MKTSVEMKVLEAVPEVVLDLHASLHVPLHASTQLSVHNVSDAKKLKEMGFDRVFT